MHSEEFETTTVVNGYNIIPLPGLRAFLAVARVRVLFWEENGIPYSITTDYKFLFNGDDNFHQNQYIYLHFNLEICIISYVLQLDCELPLISESELGAR